MMGTFAVTSYFGSNFYERLGPKVMISSGALLVIGTFLLSLISAGDGYGSLVLGLFIVGAGVGLFYASVTTAAVTSLPDSQSSLAGGIVYMCQIGGGAIGLATITTIFTAASERDLSERAADLGTKLSDHQEAVVHGLLAGTDAVSAALARLSGPIQVEIEQSVRESFVHGLNVGMTVVAGLALVGLVVCVLFVGGRLRGGGSEPEAGPTEPDASR